MSSMPPGPDTPPLAPRPSIIGIVRFFLNLPLRILRLERIPPGWPAAAAAVLFVLSTVGAVMQYLRPYQWHTPYQRFHLAWWLKPAEWNLDAGLPEIKGNINAIAFAPGKRLWIAGDAGLLGFSDDQGATWTFLQFDVATQQFRIPAANTPATASSRWEIIPEVYAAQIARPSSGGKDPLSQQEQRKPAANQVQSPANQTQQQVPNQQSPVQRPLYSALAATPNPVEFGNLKMNSDKAFTAKGIVMLADYTYPLQVIWGKKKLTSLEDIKSLKLRVAQPEQGEMVRRFGGTSVTISAPEVPSALDRGVVDGIFTAGVGAVLWKDLLKYGYVLIVNVNNSYFIANTEAFNKLAPDLQAKVRKVAEDTARWDQETMQKEEADSVQVLTAAGYTFTKAKPEDNARAVAAMTPYWDEWAKSRGKVIVEALAKVRAALGR